MSNDYELYRFVLHSLFIFGPALLVWTLGTRWLEDHTRIKDPGCLTYLLGMAWMYLACRVLDGEL